MITQEEWITDRMPEEEGYYLCTLNNGMVRMLRLYIYDGQCNWGYVRRKVIAWVPMPKGFYLEVGGNNHKK